MCKLHFKHMLFTLHYLASLSVFGKNLKAIRLPYGTGIINIFERNLTKIRPDPAHDEDRLVRVLGGRAGQQDLGGGRQLQRTDGFFHQHGTVFFKPQEIQLVSVSRPVVRENLMPKLLQRLCGKL